ncbi:protein FAM136A isoform X3 [Lemur catta]|uniref:protein FAM136A isoform X3 n=1 Tax=Lemur catta TaxID=9447 RepID=UPI001E26CCC9|nr:protein FAM136A isoform X3 [Lemur catta]
MRGRHGGASSGASAGGRGLHGEESGERKHPEDAGEQPEAQKRRAQGERPERRRLPVSPLARSCPLLLRRTPLHTALGLMFRCSASCCDDSQASMQQVHQCIERCHAPLAQAQALVTNELEKFQDRLARCTMHCNDKAKDSIDAGSKELQVKRQLDSCVTKCVDDHMHLIPTMTKKMKESLVSIGK